MGYPPFYRALCVTYDRTAFNHPDMDHSGSRRGGWIIDAGLTHPIPASLYAGSMSRQFHESCCRVRDIVCDYLLPHFSGEIGEEAASVLRYMRVGESGSGAYSRISGELRELTVGRCSQGLTAEQCVFAVSIFDHKETLSETERLILHPIVVPVLAAAVRGVHDIYQYINNESVKMDITVQALFLENPVVYLVDCITK